MLNDFEGIKSNICTAVEGYYGLALKLAVSIIYDFRIDQNESNCIQSPILAKK